MLNSLNLEQKEIAMEDRNRSHDIISSLPQDILLLIVSFLPLKEAVRTSILSSLWRRLVWTPHHVNLDIDLEQRTSNKANEGVFRAIGAFLRSYNNPELCKLCVGLSKREKLIILATKGVNKELHLDFSEEQQVMTNDHFNLNLEVICQSPTNHFSEFSGFNFLKTLHLRSVTHLAENIVPSLFSNFQFLECLKLEKCIGLRRLDVKDGGFLESLTVVDCPNMSDITLSAPALKSFSYIGILPQIQLKNVSNLVDVMLDMRDGIGLNQFDCEELLSLLAALKDVEILTLSGWLLEIDGGRNPITCPHFYQYWHEPYFLMHCAILKSTSLPLEHLKVVKMVGFKYQEDELLLIDLLLKKAVILQLMTVTSGENHSWQVIDGGRNPIHCPHFYQHWHEPYFLMHCAILKSTSLPLEHLKMVKDCGV
ncbi:hypothetical protein F0562_016759 [Nyssa sinensis]|uniref:F-box domain-containing protein n=1 Tax=Nyssa sinensis TaxID=561372 RepID=A0A5J4ZFG7_9ASTE|nr:hypothetical protein F0562_016759 [Nyssa sinensis]